MGRIVTNKYSNNPIVVKQDFYNDINVSSDSEKSRIARGRIILSPGLDTSGNVDTNTTVIWGINEHDEPVVLGQSLNIELPPEITQAISNAISNTIEEVEDYADREIERKIEEFSILVISSADTMYNELKGYIDNLSAGTESITNEIDGRLTNEIVTERERIDELSAYTMNLKLSDHFMITDDEYRMLSVLGVLDGDNISNLTYDLNGLERGSIIYYNDEIYYCIYDENGGGGGGGDTGSTPTITGTTLEIQYIISGGTIILDESVTIEDHTVILPIGGGDQGGDAEVNGNTIEDDSVYIDSEDEHTLVLGNNYTYDEENNTIIIN